MSLMTLEQFFKLVTALIVIVSLTFLIIGLKGVFFGESYDQEDKDLIRIIAELQELNSGEVVVVPVFSDGYEIYGGFVDNELKNKLPRCKTGKFCICSKKADSDYFENCEPFELEDVKILEMRDIGQGGLVPMEKSLGIKIERTNDAITVSVA